MNRRSFFWFLPALPVALLTKPAEARKVMRDRIPGVRALFLQGGDYVALDPAIQQVYTVDTITDSDEIIRQFRQSEERIIKSIADRVRRGGQYSRSFKIT